MDQVLRYDIPVIHPIAVHFPFVLVLLALGLVFIWLIRDRLHWLSMTLGAQVLAFIGTWVAYLSGEEMEEQSEGVPIVEELVHLHEDMAMYSLWAIGISIIVLFAARHLHLSNSSHPGTPLWVRLVGCAVQLIAAILIAWTAHIGGTMVWGVIS